MVENFLKVWPFPWITCENACDQIPSRVGNRYMLWETVTILSDSAVRCFHVGRFEGRFSYYQSVDNDS